jgi:hypothetical protein
MSREDFPVNCRVRDNDDHSNKGTVIGHPVSNPEMIAVEWDNGELSKVSFDWVEKIDESLEKDFKEIEDKLKQAAELLNEAQALAEKQGTDLNTLHYDGEISFTEMFRALDNGGWSSSSMRC